MTNEEKDRQPQTLADLVRAEGAGIAAASQKPISGPRQPKYLSLVRKEARLRAEQIDRLTAIARRLNRQKIEGEGERLTENTLIRLAVDLLFEKANKLAGATEDELRDSLELPPIGSE